MKNHRHCFDLYRFSIGVWVACLVAHLNVATAQSPITALTFSADSQRVIAGSQHGLMMMDWPRLDNKQIKPLEMDSIHDVSFSPDGRHLLVAGGSPGSVGVVQLRSWPDLELIRSWSEHQDVVYAIAWRADGQEWVSSSWDGYCRVCKIDATASHVTMKSHSGPVFAATYLSNGQIATAGADRTIVVWDSASGLPSKVLRQPIGAVHALAYQLVVHAKNGEPLLASASEDRTVRFWQPSIGRMVRFQRFKNTPRSIAWTQDGSGLLVGCDDGTVFQLDAITLTHPEILHQGESVMNLIIVKDGAACLTEHSSIKKLE